MPSHDSSLSDRDTVHPLLSFFVALLAIAGPLTGGRAHAQESEKTDETDTLTVTGSRLLRSEPSASNSPVLTVEAQAIESLGAVNAEDVVRDLPQSVAGVSPGVNLGNPGVASLDLRGLGATRTLVLVDGKRFMPYDASGIVDVNNIPLQLVEAVDVVTGGASTVYGSDAMAGVVNFRLKKNFEGLQAGGTFSRTGAADGNTSNVHLTGGINFLEGRGNAVLHLGWTDRDPVSTANRDFSRFALATASGLRGGSVVDTQGTLFCLPQACRIGGSPEFLASFQPDGSLAPTGNRVFNYNLYNYLRVPQERMQGTALVNFELSERVRAYGRFSAAENRIESSIAPSGTFFTRAFTFPLNSPYLSDQARLALTDRDGNGQPDASYDTNSDGVIDADAVATEYFARRTLETGPRLTKHRLLAWQAVSGLQGTVFDDWRWDASYQYGRTKLLRDYTNDINQDFMQASMLGCPSGSPAGCVAGNFFGDGNLSNEAARFIALTVEDAIFSTQQVLTGTLSGTLGENFRVPGARAISTAVGVEYRREQSKSFPDDCLSTPGCSGGYGSVEAVRNDYNVKEIFGELLVPLVEERRFAHTLDLETGLRWSDYSTIGSVSAYKFGAGWAPFSPELRLRGMYQKAVRAPNIFEFGSPRQQNRRSVSGNDPCSGEVSAAMRELCIATGVPDSLIPSGGGASTVPNFISGQVNVFEGGNPDLQEEDSDTLTFGFVWSPGGPLEGMALQLDWYSIEIDNAIDTLSSNQVLNACYLNNTAGDPNRPACALVHRNPLTGGLVGDSAYGISQAYENIAFLKTEGIDLLLRYGLKTETIGSFDFTLAGTRVLRNERKSSQEFPTLDCAGKYGASCGSPDPTLRFNQQTVWTIRAFDLGYRWRYLKGSSFDNPDPDAAIDAFRNLGDRHYVDLLFGWRPQQRAGLSVRAGINNLFDRDPPLVGEDAGPADRNGGNTYPGTFDTLGRTFFVGATQQF